MLRLYAKFSPVDVSSLLVFFRHPHPVAGYSSGVARVSELSAILGNEVPDVSIFFLEFKLLKRKQLVLI